MRKIATLLLLSFLAFGCAKPQIQEVKEEKKQEEQENVLLNAKYVGTFKFTYPLGLSSSYTDNFRLELVFNDKSVKAKIVYPQITTIGTVIDIEGEATIGKYKATTMNITFTNLTPEISFDNTNLKLNIISAEYFSSVMSIKAEYYSEVEKQKLQTKITALLQ